MAAPYSLDLREKVVEKYNNGNITQEEIGNIFQIGISTIKRWLKKYRETGDLNPNYDKQGRPTRINERGLETISKAIEINNTITLEDLSNIYFKKHKVKVGRSVLSRVLAKLNLRRKKLSVYSPEKDNPENKKKDQIT